MSTNDYYEILEHVGIVLDNERQSDGSVVWTLLIGDEVVNCLSERHAQDAAYKIAAAIEDASGLIAGKAAK